MTVAIGKECVIRYRWCGDGPPPGVGDLLRTPAGSCYQILAAVRSEGSERWRFRCVRLARDAVRDGDPGVFPLEWDSRRRRGGRRRGQQGAGRRAA